MEDEIDLRKYLDVLFRHWKLIVSITVIAVIVAGLVSFLGIPLTYEAKASVLLTKTRAEIVFEPKYQTSLLEEQEELKKALVALVKSNTVAADVIEQLANSLETYERSITRIQDNINVRTEGDLIEIMAKSTDANRAAEIANAWAESYVSYINGLYAGSILSPEELQAQAVAAKQEYEERQQEFEYIVGNNTIAELNQKIADKELLMDVISLREQIAAGSLSPASAAANSLAIVLVQAGAFTTLPSQIQVALDGLTSLSASNAALLHDIDALISTLESRIGGQRGQSINELQKEILILKADLEKEVAIYQELIRARDVAWETYTTLDNKATELKVASQAQDIVVRVAVPAIVPGTPISAHKITNIVIALVLGAIIGIFGAFVMEYFRSPGRTSESGTVDQINDKSDVSSEL